MVGGGRSVCGLGLRKRRRLEWGLGVTLRGRQRAGVVGWERWGWCMPNIGEEGGGMANSSPGGSWHLY